MRVTLTLPQWRALVKRANDGIAVAQNRCGHGGGYTMSRPAMIAIDKINASLRARGIA